MATRPTDSNRSPSGITRRRSLGLFATAAGLGLANIAGMGGARAADVAVHRWRGICLGARANLAIVHPDAAEARRLIALALAEIERLESVFSLYRADSALSRLNRDGALHGPPLDLVVLLSRAWQWGARTAGAFDITVQPLWTLYRDHFLQSGADPDGPPFEDIEAARRSVDYRAVDVQPHRVAFARPGMAVTLNGIAQGYITDRVADLLRSEGLQNVLIDLGEIRALGSRVDGTPWRVGVANPDRDQEALLDSLRLVDRAVATSSVAGTMFGDSQRFHHLLDPRTGRPTRGLTAASVVAVQATDADALSTALLVAVDAADRTGLSEAGVERILTVDDRGRMTQERIRPA